MIIDGKDIILRDFSGMHNLTGMRTFGVVIDDFIQARLLSQAGYKVQKMKDSNTYFVRVKVLTDKHEKWIRYESRIFVDIWDYQNPLDKDLWHIIDSMNIDFVVMDLLTKESYINDRYIRMFYLKEMHIF